MASTYIKTITGRYNERGKRKGVAQPVGLETRKGRLYYYRKERSGGRIRSVYAGAGEFGRALSLLDGLGRAEAEERRETDRAARAKREAADRAFDELTREVEAVAAGHLVALGYHSHKRQWRLIRGGKR